MQTVLLRTQLVHVQVGDDVPRVTVESATQQKLSQSRRSGQKSLLVHMSKSFWVSLDTSFVPIVEEKLF